MICRIFIINISFWNCLELNLVLSGCDFPSNSSCNPFLLYRSSSSESQWQPEVFWIPAGQAEKSWVRAKWNRGEGKEAREEGGGWEWGFSYRKGKIWAALQRRRNQAGKFPLVYKNFIINIYCLFVFWFLTVTDKLAPHRLHASRAGSSAVSLTTTSTRSTSWAL